MVPCSVTGELGEAEVRVRALTGVTASLASPKSRSLAPVLVSMMLPGLRSL